MFFIDTNVLVYALADSRYAAGATAIVDATVAGATPGVTSTLVLEELWHLELSGRVPGLDGAGAAFERALPDIVAIDRTVLARAFAMTDVPGLGSADRIHVATCHELGIDTIVSADTDMSLPTLRRVDPSDSGAIDTLI